MCVQLFSSGKPRNNLGRRASRILFKKVRFLKFDIEEFYPSISPELLDRALEYVRSITEITDEEELILKTCRESLLFNDSKSWVKKSKKNFDVTMGSLDGADVAELIGVYLLAFYITKYCQF